jgi:hypothetical protein
MNDLQALSRDVEALTALFSTVQEPQGEEEEPQLDRAEELLERWGVQPELDQETRKTRNG